VETRTFIASGAILPQRELTRMVNEVSDDVIGFRSDRFLLKNIDVTELMENGLNASYLRARHRVSLVTAAARAPACSATFGRPR
jgi:hypothetical protein